MKTFEERYTAWIDGQLENGVLAAFEQELARRADVGEASADKADAGRLRRLLNDHLQAPALTNPDFFNHQLLERIEAESPRPARSMEKVGGQARPALFAWGFLRLVGLGAFSLFAAGALYYGLMPQHPGSAPDAMVAQHTPADVQINNPAMEASAPAESPDAQKQLGATGIQMAKISPTPSPIDIEETPDIKATVPDQPVNPTTATPLHYNKPNVNVLWLNGLDYLPNVPEAEAATPAPAPTAGTGP